MVLVSGDNMAPEYNEPDAMRGYLIDAGVPAEDVVADYAGFDTYDSCARAKRIFGVSELIMVTQSYHLPRAVATCRALGVDATGVGDDTPAARAGLAARCDPGPAGLRQDRDRPGHQTRAGARPARDQRRRGPRRTLRLTSSVPAASPTRVGLSRVNSQVFATAHLPRPHWCCTLHACNTVISVSRKEHHMDWHEHGPDSADADEGREEERRRARTRTTRASRRRTRASAGRVAGRTSTCRRPTTPRRGSRAGCPSEWFTEVDRDRRPGGDHRGRHAGRRGGRRLRSAEGRISRFRAETRATRIEIAEEAQARYGRKVSWGAQLGETGALFTHISVPVMTRLRQPERQVLDTLVDAGVARSRSEALAWAVKLVGEHAETWLTDLRGAMEEVDKLRATGPRALRAEARYPRLRTRPTSRCATARCRTSGGQRCRCAR